MDLSPEMITALVVALTGFLSGIAGLFSKRSRNQKDELDELRAQYQIARQQLVLLDRWTFEMTRTLSQNGLDIPEPPSGLNTSIGVKTHDNSN